MKGKQLDNLNMEINYIPNIGGFDINAPMLNSNGEPIVADRCFTELKGKTGVLVIDIKDGIIGNILFYDKGE
jgi:hypothetical protein